MPEWLLLLLGLLVNFVVAFWLHRRAYNRGYEAGMEDSLAIGRMVDDALKGGHRRG